MDEFVKLFHTDMVVDTLAVIAVPAAALALIVLGFMLLG